MSKAFTKETDDVPDVPARRLGVPVPDGVPNYVTPAGLRALRAELDALARAQREQREERDPAAEDRIRELSEHLAVAQAVEPVDRERVGIGATVEVEDEDGVRTRYRIVGAIEAVPREGAVSWLSPIARALIDSRVGDTVMLPRGEVEVVAIDYA